MEEGLVMTKKTNYLIGVLLSASDSYLNVMQFKKQGKMTFYRTGNSDKPWNLKKARRTIPINNLVAELEEAKKEMQSRGLPVPGVTIE